MTTRWRTIAADLNHDTVYKPYIEAGEAERAKVAKMFEEAAAPDQIENRGLNDG